MPKKRFYINLSTLLRQLFFLTEKDKGIDDAIELLEKQTGLQKEVDSIKSMFSGAQDFVRVPFYFGYIALLSNVLNVVKNAGGNISDCYRAFYDSFIQNPHRIKLDMKDSIGLLTYFSAVTVVSTICVTIYIIFVLPQFEQMYEGVGQKLPALTRYVLTVGSEFSGLFIAIVVVVISAVLFLLHRMVTNVSALSYFSDRFIKIPYLGEIFKAFNVYLSFNILLLLIKSGLSKSDSLDALENLSNNNSCIDTVALKNGKVTDPYSAEYSLSLASSLDTFDDELKHLVDEHQFVDAEKLNELKTMVLILFVCFAVSIFGTLLVAMYLPIFQMGNIVSG